MPSMKDIKRRIRSVQSSEQITKAMKMVAAAKFQKSQNRLMRVKPYVNGYEELMREMIDDIYETLHPVFRPREGNNVLLIVVTSSRGLCGGFNSSVIKKTVSYIEENTSRNIRLITVGNKAERFFRKKYSDKVVQSFSDLADSPSMGTMIDLFRLVFSSFLSNDYQEVKFIYNRFKSAMTQITDVRDFLPVDYIEPERAETVVYEYYPQFEGLAVGIVEEFLKTKMYYYLIESTTGEFGARMTAMSAATDNAAKMISELTLEYNRARQAQITKEISEIVGGAEALKS